MYLVPQLTVSAECRASIMLVGKLEQLHSVPLFQLHLVLRAGADHVVALTMSGKVLTWGTGQQGQLGRLPARTTGRGDAAGKLLTPSLVTFKRQRGVQTTQ